VSLDEQVVVIDNLSSGHLENIQSSMREGNVQFVEIDIANREELETYMMGEEFDAIFHLAAVPRVQFSIANPHLTNETNITGTLNMLLAAKRQGIQRFVYSASSSAYGNQDDLPLTEDMKPNPMSPYALQKLAGEQYAKMFHDLYGMETVSLRYFNVYGKKQDPEGAYATLVPKFINRLMDGKTAVINGDGEQTRDFCMGAGSRVLMGDLTWKPIEDIRQGDRVVSFDEKPTNRKRNFRVETVEHTTSYISTNVVKIKTENRDIVCTNNHPWLTNKSVFRDARWLSEALKRGSPGIKSFSTPVSYEESQCFRDGYHSYRDHGSSHYSTGLAVTDMSFVDRFVSHENGEHWNRYERSHSYSGSRTLQPGKKEVLDYHLSLIDNADWSNEEFCRGWLSGVFDSEGAVSKWSLRLSNKDERVCDRIRYVLNMFDFDWSEMMRKDTLVIFSILGGLPEQVRFFASFKPAVARKPDMDGLEVKGHIENIVDIHPTLCQRVYNLQISNHKTFIVDGLLCHNTSVEDVVEANILAAWPDNELAFGKTFNIGAGHNRSVNEVAQVICAAVGADTSLVEHGPAVIEPKDTLASIEQASRLLSWEPMVDFSEGLSRTVEYYMEQKEQRA